MCGRGPSIESDHSRSSSGCPGTTATHNYTAALSNMEIHTRQQQQQQQQEQQRHAALQTQHSSSGGSGASGMAIMVPPPAGAVANITSRTHADGAAGEADGVGESSSGSSSDDGRRMSTQTKRCNQLTQGEQQSHFSHRQQHVRHCFGPGAPAGLTTAFVALTGSAAGGGDEFNTGGRRPYGEHEAIRAAGEAGEEQAEEEAARRAAEAEAREQVVTALEGKVRALMRRCADLTDELIDARHTAHRRVEAAQEEAAAARRQAAFCDEEVSRLGRKLAALRAEQADAVEWAAQRMNDLQRQLDEERGAHAATRQQLLQLQQGQMTAALRRWSATGGGAGSSACAAEQQQQHGRHAQPHQSHQHHHMHALALHEHVLAITAGGAGAGRCSTGGGGAAFGSGYSRRGGAAAAGGSGGSFSHLLHPLPGRGVGTEELQAAFRAGLLAGERRVAHSGAGAGATSAPAAGTTCGVSAAARPVPEPIMLPPSPLSPACEHAAAAATETAAAAADRDAAAPQASLASSLCQASGGSNTAVSAQAQAASPHHESHQELVVIRGEGRTEAARGNSTATSIAIDTQAKTDVAATAVLGTQGADGGVLVGRGHGEPCDAGLRDGSVVSVGSVCGSACGIGSGPASPTSPPSTAPHSAAHSKSGSPSVWGVGWTSGVAASAAAAAAAAAVAAAVVAEKGAAGEEAAGRPAARGVAAAGGEVEEIAAVDVGR